MPAKVLLKKDMVKKALADWVLRLPSYIIKSLLSILTIRTYSEEKTTKNHIMPPPEETTTAAADDQAVVAIAAAAVAESHTSNSSHTNNGSNNNNNNSHSNISNNERKRWIRKQKKDQKRKAHFTRILLESGCGSAERRSSSINNSNNNNDAAAAVEGCTTSNITTNRSGGGKASRSRRARNGEVSVGSWEDHRPCGGAPLLRTRSPHQAVIRALDEWEAMARRRARPAMTERAIVTMDNHGAMEDPRETCANSRRAKETDYWNNGGVCSLSECNLRSFSISQIPMTRISGSLSTTSSLSPLSCMTTLDLSRNEIWDLPDDLSMLSNLTLLDLSRNWFQNIPLSIATSRLHNLTSLNMSSNMLDGQEPWTALHMPQLQAGLPKLVTLDLSMNKKCGRQDCADYIQAVFSEAVAAVPPRRSLPLNLHMTITFPRPADTFVGANPAARDATLLRSQLEPWSTSALRRRLVADFGQALPAEHVPRSDVMKQLLQCYREEEEEHGCRTVVHTEGIPIDPTLVQELLVALQAWSHAAVGGNQERPSIHATNYMILTSPAELKMDSKNAYKSAIKLETHKTIWDLAQKAMMSVDPEYAKLYTSLAVTHGFQGSPHIDRQNSAAFYGLSLGDFEEGTGGICVECSARIVACVNTKNRLAKVDGRNPHWVAPYDHQNTERHSLIFYKTVGEREPVGPAIFQIPTTEAVRIF